MDDFLYKKDTRLTPRAREMRKKATNQENHLWYDYLRAYPVRFHRQFIIWEYIADFCCPNAKLIIELDGRHHAEQGQLEYDQERDAYLRGRGYEVLRFKNEEVERRFERVCRVIDEAVKERHPQPPAGRE